MIYSVKAVVSSWSEDKDGRVEYHEGRGDTIQYKGQSATFTVPLGYAVSYEVYGAQTRRGTIDFKANDRQITGCLVIIQVHATKGLR